jgi:hypothetical protein
VGFATVIFVTVVVGEVRMILTRNVTSMGRVHYLGDYHSYHAGQNPRFNRYSGLILDVKDKLPRGLTYFADELETCLGADFAVAVVPSHTPNVFDSGIRQLAQIVCERKGLIDATSCLVRVREIDKLAHGGDRSVDVHLNSIAVRHRNLIQNRDVVVLDDVTTSGNSLVACELLLRNAGARTVELLALGRTAS